MYSEDELLPLSGLQHLLFCERQCALIHVEGIWQENALTIEGVQLHRKVDQTWSGDESGVRVARGLAVRSLELGLSGRADVVEFLPGAAGGPERPHPVEYKRGRRRRWQHDEVQLCAQAMALEEMLGVVVPRGALYYGKSRRRLEVECDSGLREKARLAARHFRKLVETRTTPIVARKPKCRSCSLLTMCQPDATAARGKASRYLERIMAGREAT